MNKILHILILLFLGIYPTSFVISQFHESVLPDLEGDTLLSELRDAFKPNVVLTAANSKDTLFSSIYAQNDSLTCVYTGHTVYLDPAMDPTQAAFMDNSPNGINTEHTYPKSLGAEFGNAQADMHHLYPSIVGANTARANLPFGDIPDNQTERWFILNQTQTAIPVADIDLFSEVKDDLFEPREQHKGNVARAMFYFYTMYKTQADSEDSTYFELQRQTFCEWHQLDPVDSLEWVRNQMIAFHQEGKPNPFILDCTLAGRSYCQDVMFSCNANSTKDIQRQSSLFEVQSAFPNPFSTHAIIQLSLNQKSEILLLLSDIQGRVRKTIRYSNRPTGAHQIKLVPQDLGLANSGLLFCRIIVTDSKNNWSQQTLKLIYNK